MHARALVIPLPNTNVQRYFHSLWPSHSKLRWREYYTALVDTRGMGGVAIVWRDIPSPSRIRNSTVVAVSRCKACLINLYMPSRNPSKKTQEYLDNSMNNHHAHFIILHGDMNIDAFNPSYLNDRCRIKLLVITSDFNPTMHSKRETPTASAHNGDDASHIDLAFTSVCHKTEAYQ